MTRESGSRFGDHAVQPLCSQIGGQPCEMVDAGGFSEFAQVRERRSTFLDGGGISGKEVADLKAASSSLAGRASDFEVTQLGVFAVHRRIRIEPFRATFSGLSHHPKVGKREITSLARERVGVYAQGECGVRVPELVGDPTDTLPRLQGKSGERVPGSVQSQRANTLPLGAPPHSLPPPKDVPLIQGSPCLGAEHPLRDRGPAAVHGLSAPIGEEIEECRCESRGQRNRARPAALGGGYPSLRERAANRDAGAIEVDVLPLECEGLSFARSSRKQEVQQRGEARLMLPCHCVSDPVRIEKVQGTPK